MLQKQSLLLSAVALAAVVMLPLASAQAAAPVKEPVQQGIRAFKLCTGADNLSHIQEGTLDPKFRTDVDVIHFKETPAHSSYDWHPAPEEQYVISLAGTLEFFTTGGETFVLRPGDVLVAQDTTGPGHRWEMIGDQPWRRAYITLKPGVKTAFVPKAGSKGC
ncbi:hypothetical protein ALQ04_01295 [Pseudomonas cichorii]|uniref:Cupin 2 conserved barrel domain-containing protein n=1 Tax=Pseudomonas cichorii TaxID=36746 RepID=A0A3M4M8H7_PSECI|nr:hypothetical protein [Pseudomonas cichorii]RMQ49859.1 hypothetical protein ALQ04_01295 [Pseudomonas cichorii]